MFDLPFVFHILCVLHMFFSIGRILFGFIWDKLVDHATSLETSEQQKEFWCRVKRWLHSTVHARRAANKFDPTKPSSPVTEFDGDAFHNLFLAFPTLEAELGVFIHPDPIRRELMVDAAHHMRMLFRLPADEQHE
jgi:hypothetical protein